MEIWESKPPGTLWAPSGLLRDSFIFNFTLACIYLTQKVGLFYRSLVSLSLSVHNGTATETPYGLEGSDYCSHLEARNYLYFTPVQTETEAHPATCTNDYRGSFLRPKRPGMALTSHNLLAPRLSTIRVIPLLEPHVIGWPFLS
jgi:hypothetical protein